MVPEETLDRAAVDDVSPRYLRKQKPAGVKRRRNEPGSRPRWRRVSFPAMMIVAAGLVLGFAVQFLFFAPSMLLHPDGVEIHGLQYVTRQQVLEVFSGDIGQSVIRVPLADRLAALESISWVKRASIERVLPNSLRVQIDEREPLAYFHAQGDMKLIDADGVVLDRPAGVNFNLPVVTGLDSSLPVEERARRMRLFDEFLKAMEAVRPGAAAEVSEASLGNPGDVQVTLAGAPELAGQGPVVVHFGHENFGARYRLFLDDFASWKVRAGNVEQVDLRYDGQALVTPANPLMASTLPVSSAVPAAPPAPESLVPVLAAKKILRSTTGKQQKRKVGP